MTDSELDLARDIERVKQIPIISTILDVVCQTTGMGFAAVARVTRDRWIACSVRDQIQFGMVPGGELKVETTICNEIQNTHKPVIIDHVQESDQFCSHPTPILYGFQSYISFPIFLKTGEFFGTLCAIDPNPAQLNNPKVTGMFSLFAELISFHLQQLDLLERSQMAVHNLNRQLAHSTDENRQYRHISIHTLQEPLRKIRFFSGLLVDATEQNEAARAREIALKMDFNAYRISTMIEDIADFSLADQIDPIFEPVDLNKIVAEVCSQLGPQLEAAQATIQAGDLPSIQGVPQQLKKLFDHLLRNAIKFVREDVTPEIVISGTMLAQLAASDQFRTDNESGLVEIKLADNGVGIDKSQLERIFDIFSQLPGDRLSSGEGFGLAYCRKIVANHFGSIKAESEVGRGTTISVVLPVNHYAAKNA